MSVLPPGQSGSLAFMDLNTNKVHDAKSFLKTMSTFPLTASGWPSADDSWDYHHRPR